MQTDYTHAERSVWLRWVIATAIGSIIGGAMSGAVVFGGETRFADVTSPMIGVIAMASTDVVAFGLYGAVIGIAQWLALRRAIARSGWWVAATTGGWAIAGIVSGALSGTFGGRLTGVGPDAGSIGVAVSVAGSIAALFFLPGTLQWLVLRRQARRAGWWVLAYAGGFLVAVAVSFPVMLIVGRAAGWNFPSAQAWSLAGLLVGLIDGAITGAVLVWLLRQPVTGAAREMAAAP